MRQKVKIRDLLLIFFTFFIFQNVSATNTWFSKNKTYSDEVKFKGFTFQLQKGDWFVAQKYDWHIMGIQSDGVTLVQIENNTIKALLDISQLTTSGKRQGLVSEWLNTAYFNGPTDGCYEKSEYYLVKFWQEGMSANCLKVRHIDLKKEMFNPDYKIDADGYSEPYYTAQFKYFVKKKKIRNS